MKSGGAIKVINAKGVASRPRKFFDDAEAFAKGEGAKGLAWIALRDGEMKGPVVKFLSEEEKAALVESTGASDGDALFFGAGARKDTNELLLGKVRAYLAEALELVDPSVAAFCWIVDFPMFEWNEDEKKVDFSHNPFSMPQGGLKALEEQDPLDVFGVSIRHCVQRRRVIVRGYPEPPAQRHAQGIRDRRLHRGHGEIKVSGFVERFPLRGASAWWHRAGVRPNRDASGRRTQHSRSPSPSPSTRRRRT